MMWRIVFWQASYADVPVALYRAGSNWSALRRARRETEYGEMSCTSDQLFAQFIRGDKAQAVTEYQRLAALAQAKQSAAMASAA